MNKIKLLVILILIGGISFAVYHFKFRESEEEKKQKELFNAIEKTNVEINKYVVYGTHLNIEGVIDKKLYEDNILSAELIFKNLDGKDEKFKIEYELSDDKFVFKTSDYINEGINLENLKTGNYYILIKITEKNLSEEKDAKDKVSYYSLTNKTSYKNLEYYTITKNDKNNKIDISFNKYESKDIKHNYMNILVQEVKLPNNVYDIAIDPGHGGKDGGAISTLNGKEYAEKDITLDYAKDLKKELEKLGLKVKLTRDGSNEEELGIYDMYGKNGRAVVPNAVKAKYMISLHLNSAEYKMKNGGIEVYSPSNSKLEFAKVLAKNIVETAKTNYSPNVTYKTEDGVYVRNFSYSEIESSKNSAKEAGLEPYNITTDTPYLFIIRETGGVATNAYVDGRNKDYGKNLYYNSNMGVETYLVELGFMNSNKDLTNVLNNKSLYIEGIKKSFKSYLNL